MFFFFFNDTATTEIYTLSLHDALPISASSSISPTGSFEMSPYTPTSVISSRSEEHTSELQSQSNLVCRLLLEKKNTRARRAMNDIITAIVNANDVCIGTACTSSAVAVC